MHIRNALKPGKIVLEDGTVFKGFSFGAMGTKFGEAVFNTSITGYQEILTDPSYKGQIVAMTYPLIGNYGVNTEDAESSRIFLEGFVVRECSIARSNWRSSKTLDEYLKEKGIIAVEGIDTRALTRHIRLQGAMTAAITTENLSDKLIIKKLSTFDGLVGKDLVKEVTVKKPFVWNKSGKFKVAVLDCGVKFNILRELTANNCKVSIFPAGTTAEEIISAKPNGLLISNGPGDPQGAPYVVKTIQKLIGKLPMFGICFGQQFLGLALGGETYKLKFGHHGANHPVKDLRTGKVYITTQNHGFCVDIDSLNKKEIEVTHINLNDNTLEGIRHKKLPLFAVQFHPEASAGPHDAKYLFREFITMMSKHK
ncbi:MAG: glutamine-hydrolyzing carbamoyl-phosphate synthase small subunit [Candidatus Omnitrophota bacterium]|jgi:carbamoyl-phosphate synthase small subunit